MTYVLYACAALAFLGFYVNFRRKNGHGMAYSFVMLAIWIAAALWWSGKIG